jgi:hypothetical protein
MEQPREQPQVGAPPYPYQYQAHPQPAPRPSAWRVFSSFWRMLLRRLIYGMVWVLRPLRNHIGTSIITLLLLGVVAFLAFSLYGPRTAAAPDPRAAVILPASAVENYLTGRKTFNADLMWEAFSNDYQARQLQQGGSKATMQSVAQQEKRLGLQYRQVQYIGAVKREEANSGYMYYYSVDVVAGGRTFRLPVVFMTDRSDKIEIMMSPLDSVIQQLTQ